MGIKICIVFCFAALALVCAAAATESCTGKEHITFAQVLDLKKYVSTNDVSGLSDFLASLDACTGKRLVNTVLPDVIGAEDAGTILYEELRAVWVQKGYVNE